MKRLTKLLMSAIVALSAASPLAAQELRVLTSWDNSYPPVKVMLPPILADIEQALDGQVSTRIFGPETVPPFEQFEPVARGLFDILYTNGGYHYDSVGIGGALDTFEKDHERMRSSGIWDFAAEEYAKQGLKLLGIIYNPGFNLLLKSPLEEGQGLAGRRVRTIPVFNGLVQDLGGSPVVLPMPEVYPALERGVVDGAAWPTLGAYDARWYEVAEYLTRPTFGQGVQLFLMNQAKWDALDPAAQEAISGVLLDWEEKSAALMDEVEKAEEENLIAAGMEITEFSEEQIDTVRRAFFRSGIELATQRDPEAAEKLREMAEQAGLAP